MDKAELQIPLHGYSVAADVYKGDPNEAVLLSLIGRTSRKSKPHYEKLYTRAANELGVTTVIFDYSGHGESPFDIDELRPAQHFLEVITVFDWIKQKYTGRKTYVIGSSYGGFLATQLTKYRDFDKLILRAPAIYRPRDFYTEKKDEDRGATSEFRKNKDALSEHPLLTRASKFKGASFLLIHERDEQIPKETTDAYTEAFHPEISSKDITHSLDNATPEQIADYENQIIEWLKK